MKLILKEITTSEDTRNPLYQSDDCQHLLNIYGEYYKKVSYELPWVGYFVVRDGQEIVGTCGFTGPPENETVEIAYWTFIANEGQGIASFACEALVKKALFANNNIIITAKTAPEENASTRILKKNGFERKGEVQDHEIGNAWLWVYNPE